MSRLVVAMNAHVFIERMQALGIPGAVKQCFLFVERAWSEEKRRRVESHWWVTSRDEASVFLSDADAWAAFDRAGTGPRSDYQLEEVA